MCRPELDNAALAAWYRRNRQRSRALFDVLTEDVYYAQPIALRHPIVFYEGHLPAFSFNTLVKRALGRPSIDPPLERLFARGIDPDPTGAAQASSRETWPGRDVVRAFAEEADRQVLDCLAHADLSQPGDSLLDRGEAAFAILEHEAMHQETLLYMFHRLPWVDKRAPATYRSVRDGRMPSQEWISMPCGRATLGVDAGALPFSWDNERPSCSVDVPAFAIERYNVTNAAFLADRKSVV